MGLQNSLPNTGHDLLPRGLGDVEWSLYENILTDAVDFGMNKIQLHFQGEPLLYKRFSDMVAGRKGTGSLHPSVHKRTPSYQREGEEDNSRRPG